MSSVYELQCRVVRERLEQMAATAEQTDDDAGLRLALCCLLLLDRHRVDDKGRCRWCRSRGRWWHRPRSKCSVVPVLWFSVQQPHDVLRAAR